MLNSEFRSNHWDTNKPQNDPTTAPSIPITIELKYMPANQSSKPMTVVIAPITSKVSGGASIQRVSILINSSYTMILPNPIFTY
jgi:hypothetical protein